MELLTKILRRNADEIDIDFARFKRGEKFREMATALKPGFTWNPVKNYPRNQPCFCGAPEKAKKCCLPHLGKTCSEGFAGYIRENWEKILTGEMTLPKWGTDET